MADPTQVTVEVWQEFYTALGHTTSADRGLLPFRVWQFFDAMVDAVAAGDVARFVCAAGLVAHYVGDACQPLHGSYLADGAPATPTTPAVGAGVHSAYETAMVDAFSTEILAGLQATLTRRGAEQGPDRDRPRRRRRGRPAHGPHGQDDQARRPGRGLRADPGRQDDRRARP